MGRSREERRRAEAAGQGAEALVALYLTLKGYRVLDRRVRTSAGEIDLILRRGRLLVFAEVKQRKTKDGAKKKKGERNREPNGLQRRAEDERRAAEAVTPRQQQRISRAAELLLSRRPAWHNLDKRFDVVLVTGTFRVIHIKNAWESVG